MGPKNDDIKKILSLFNKFKQLVGESDLIPAGEKVYQYIDYVNQAEDDFSLRKDLMLNIYRAMSQSIQKNQMLQWANRYDELEIISEISSLFDQAAINSKGTQFPKPYSRIQSVLSKRMNQQLEDVKNSVSKNFISHNRLKNSNTDTLRSMLKDFKNGNVDIESYLKDNTFGDYQKVLKFDPSFKNRVFSSLKEEIRSELRLRSDKLNLAKAGISSKSYSDLFDFLSNDEEQKEFLKDYGRIAGEEYKKLRDYAQKRMDNMFKQLYYTNARTFYMFQQLAENKAEYEENIKKLSQEEQDKIKKGIERLEKSGISREDVKKGTRISQIMQPFNENGKDGKFFKRIKPHGTTFNNSYSALSELRKISGRNQGSNIEDFLSGGYIRTRLKQLYQGRQRSTGNPYGDPIERLTEWSSKKGSNMSIQGIISEIDKEAFARGLETSFYVGNDGEFSIQFGAKGKSTNIAGPSFGAIKDRSGNYGSFNLRNGMLAGNQFVATTTQSGDPQIITNIEYGLNEALKAVQELPVLDKTEQINDKDLQRFKWYMREAVERGVTGISSDSSRSGNKDVKKEFFDFQGTSSSQTRTQNSSMVLNLNPILYKLMKAIGYENVPGQTADEKEQNLLQDTWDLISTFGQTKNKEDAWKVFDNERYKYILDKRNEVEKLIGDFAELQYSTQYGSSSQRISGLIQMQANLDRVARYFESDATKHLSQGQGGIQLSEKAVDARRKRNTSSLTTKYALDTGFDLNSPEEALYTTAYISENDLIKEWNNFIQTKQGQKYSNLILPSLLGGGAIMASDVSEEFQGHRGRVKTIVNKNRLFQTMKEIGIRNQSPVNINNVEAQKEVIGEIMGIDPSLIDLGKDGGIFINDNGDYTVSFTELVDQLQNPKLLGAQTGTRAISQTLPRQFFNYYFGKKSHSAGLFNGEKVDFLMLNKEAGVNDYGGLVSSILIRALNNYGGSKQDFFNILQGEDSPFSGLFGYDENKDVIYFGDEPVSLSTNGILSDSYSTKKALEFFENHKDVFKFDPKNLIISEQIMASNGYDYKKYPKYGIKEKQAEIRAIAAAELANGSTFRELRDYVESQYSNKNSGKLENMKHQIQYALYKSFDRETKADDLDRVKRNEISVGFGSQYDINLSQWNEEDLKRNFEIKQGRIPIEQYEDKNGKNILYEIDKIAKQKQKKSGYGNTYLTFGNGEYDYTFDDGYGSIIYGKKMYLPYFAPEQYNNYLGSPESVEYLPQNQGILSFLRLLVNERSLTDSYSTTKNADEQMKLHWATRRRLEAQKELIHGMDKDISDKESDIQQGLYTTRLNTGASYRMVARSGDNDNIAYISKDAMIQNLRNAGLFNTLYEEYNPSSDPLQKSQQEVEEEVIRRMIAEGKTVYARINRIPSISGRDIKYIEAAIDPNMVTDKNISMTNALAAAIRGDFDEDHANLTLFTNDAVSNDAIYSQIASVAANDAVTIDQLKKYQSIYGESGGVFKKKTDENGKETYDVKEAIDNETLAYISTAAQKNKGNVGLLSTISTNVRNFLSQNGFDENSGDYDDLILGRMTQFLFQSLEQDAISYKKVYDQVQKTINDIAKNPDRYQTESEKRNAILTSYTRGINSLQDEIDQIFDRDNQHGLMNVLDFALNNGIIKTKDGKITSEDFMRTLQDMINVNPDEIIPRLLNHGMTLEQIGYGYDQSTNTYYEKNINDLKKENEKLFGSIDVNTFKSILEELDGMLKHPVGLKNPISIIPQEGYYESALNIKYRNPNNPSPGLYRFVNQMIENGAYSNKTLSKSDQQYANMMRGNSDIKQIFDLAKIAGVSESDLMSEYFRIQQGVYTGNGDQNTPLNNIQKSPVLQKYYEDYLNKIKSSGERLINPATQPIGQLVASNSALIQSTIEQTNQQSSQVPQIVLTSTDKNNTNKYESVGLYLGQGDGHNYIAINGSQIPKGQMISGSKLGQLLMYGAFSGDDQVSQFAQRIKNASIDAKFLDYTSIYGDINPELAGFDPKKNFEYLRNTLISSTFGTYQHKLREFATQFVKNGIPKNENPADNVEHLLYAISQITNGKVNDLIEYNGTNYKESDIVEWWKDYYDTKINTAQTLRKLGYKEDQITSFFNAAQLSTQSQMTLASESGLQSILQEFSTGIKKGETYFGGTVDDIYQLEDGRLRIGDSKNKRKPDNVSQILQLSLYAKSVGSMLDELYRAQKNSELEQAYVKFGIYDQNSRDKLEKTLAYMDTNHLSGREAIDGGIITHFNPDTLSTQIMTAQLLNDEEMDLILDKAVKGEMLTQEEKTALSRRMSLMMSDGAQVQIQAPEDVSYSMNPFILKKNEKPFNDDTKNYKTKLKELKEAKSDYDKLIKNGYSGTEAAVAKEFYIEELQNELDSIYGGFSEETQRLLDADKLIEEKEDPTIAANRLRSTYKQLEKQQDVLKLLEQKEKEDSSLLENENHKKNKEIIQKQIDSANENINNLRTYLSENDQDSLNLIDNERYIQEIKNKDKESKKEEQDKKKTEKEIQADKQKKLNRYKALLREKSSIDKFEKSNLTEEQLKTLNARSTDLDNAIKNYFTDNGIEEADQSQYEAIKIIYDQNLEGQSQDQILKNYRSLLSSKKKISNAISQYKRLGYSDDSKEISSLAYMNDDIERQRINYFGKLDERGQKIASGYEALQAAPSGGGIKNFLSNDLSRGLSLLFRGGISYRVIMNLIKNMKKVYQLTLQLNQSMTNLRIVTGQNEKSAKGMLTQYNSLAKSIGATTKEVVSAGESWLRQGYSAQQSMELIKSSVYLAKLGFMDMNSASQALTSTLKGFGIAASDSMDIVDKLTTLDASYATTAGDLAKAISNTAAVAKSAGLDLDTTASALTAIIDTTQMDAGAAGNAMKTILSRYGNVKAGAFKKLMDGDSDDTTEAINDVEKVLDSLGIKIRSSSSEMRDFDDVLDDLADKWINLSDVEKNAVSTAMAGTRQRNAFDALMNNYDTYEEALQKSRNSEGSSSVKYSAYLKSIEAGVKKLENAFETLALKIESNGLVKKFFDSLSFVIRNLDYIVNLLNTFLSYYMAKSVISFSKDKLGGLLKKGGGAAEGVASATAKKNGLKGLFSGMSISKSNIAPAILGGAISGISTGISGGNNWLQAIIGGTGDLKENSLWNSNSINSLNIGTGEKTAYGAIKGASTIIGGIWGPLGAIIGGLVGDVINTITKLIIHDGDLHRTQRVNIAKKQLEALDKIRADITNVQTIIKKDSSDMSAEDWSNLKDYVLNIKTNLRSEGSVKSGVGDLFINTLQQKFGLSYSNIDSALNGVLTNSNDAQKIMAALQSAQIEKEAIAQYNATEQDRANIMKLIYGNEGNREYRLGREYLNAKTPEEREKIAKKYGKSLQRRTGMNIEQAAKAVQSQMYNLQQPQIDENEQLLESAYYSSGMSIMNEASLYGVSYQRILRDLAIEWKDKGVVGIFDRNGNINEDKYNQLLSFIRTQDNMSSILDGSSYTLKDTVKAEAAFKYFNNSDFKKLQEAAMNADDSQLKTYTDLAKQLGIIKDEFGDNEEAINKFRDEILKVDPDRLEKFARALRVSKEEAREMSDELWWMTESDLQLDNMIEKFNGLSKIMTDIADGAGMTKESINELFNKYPQILNALAKNGKDITQENIMTTIGGLLSNGSILNAIAAGNITNAFKDRDLFNKFRDSYKSDWSYIFGSTLTDEDIEILNNPETKTFKDIGGIIANSEKGIKRISEFISLTQETEEFTKGLYDILQQAETRMIDSEISNLESLKDSLNETNNLRQKELDIVKARIELENAQKNKVRVYRSGVGFTYEADQQAIKDAQENLDKLEREKSQEDIQYQIDILNQQKDMISNIESEFTYEQQKLLMDEVLGPNSGLYNSLHSLSQYITNSKLSDLVEEQLKNSGEQNKKELSDKYDDLKNSVDQYNAAKDEFYGNAETFKQNGDQEGYSQALLDMQVAAKKLKEDYNDYSTLAKQYGLKDQSAGALLDIANNAMDRDFIRKNTSSYVNNLVSSSFDKKEKLDYISLQYLIDSNDERIQSAQLDKDGKAIISRSQANRNVISYNMMNKTGMYEDKFTSGKGYDSVIKLYGKKAYIYDPILGIILGEIDDPSKVMIRNNASGSISYSGGPTFVNEKGLEGIITPQGTLTSLPSKSGILPADLTKNLWSLGEIAPNLVARMQNITMNPVKNQTSEDNSINVNSLYATFHTDSGFNSDQFWTDVKNQILLTKNRV